MRGWRQRDQGGAAGAEADQRLESGVHRRSGPETQQRSRLQRELKTLSQPCRQLLTLCPDGAQKAVPGLGVGAPVVPGAAPGVRRGSDRRAPGGQGPKCTLRSLQPQTSGAPTVRALPRRPPTPRTPRTWPEAGERGQAAAADDEVERESAHAPAQSGQPGRQLLHGIGALRGPPSRGPDGQSRAARAPRPPPPPGALAALPSWQPDRPGCGSHVAGLLPRGAGPRPHPRPAPRPPGPRPPECPGDGRRPRARDGEWGEEPGRWGSSLVS